MEKITAALAAFGGLSAIGVLIDFCMYKSEKDKLRARLEDWRLRFSDVRWANFGRKEAELSIGILDRYAGARLWSWKRWRFVAIAMASLYLLSLFWCGVRLLLASLQIDNYQFDLLFFVRDAAIALIGDTTWLPSMVLVCLAFGLSLSLTRFLARMAAKACRGPVSSVFAFSVLLLFHIVLFFIWSSVAVESFIDIVTSLVSLYTYKPRFPGETLVFDPWQEVVKRLEELVYFQHYYERHSVSFEVLFSAEWQQIGGGNFLWLTFKAATDVVANGLRILLALVFLSSFVFRPVIQVPISRLWVGVLESGKPIFTMVFGALGTLVSIAKILVK